MDLQVYPSTLVEIEEDIQLQQTRSRKGASEIVHALMCIGRDLTLAKDLLEHGQWLPWLEGMGIREDSAQLWMKISAWLDSNTEHVRYFPPDQLKLATLTRLSDPQQVEGFFGLYPPEQVDEGDRKDVRRWVNAYLSPPENCPDAPLSLPSGKYACVVVDPPWKMQKIEREERPLQSGFDYPTMSEEELLAFPVGDFSADDSHLYLWTTQKHLPLALKLAEHWGFKYQCLLTWVKNVGFTPFSWMYSTEHVIFAHRGSLPLQVLGKRLDFSAKVREHSRKPDEFYDLVQEVSPAPRVDVFGREEREGFDTWGFSTRKFNG